MTRTACSASRARRADASPARRRRSAGLLGPDLLQDPRAGPARRLGRHRPGAAAAADQRQAGHGHLHQPPLQRLVPVPPRRPPRRPPGDAARGVPQAQATRCRRHWPSFGGRARWTEPEGGFFLWVTFEPGVDTQALFPVALAEGVAFIPGNAFSPSGRFPDALRLCFASTPGAHAEACRLAAPSTASPPPEELLLSTIH